MNEESQPAIGGTEVEIPTESTATILPPTGHTITMGEPIPPVS